MKNAFTLAEVLITLGVIGVVAALTIPSLSANYQKRVLTTQLQKAYAEISQAGLMAMSEDMSSDFDNTRAVRNNEFINEYIPKAKSCGITTCFAEKYKSYWSGGQDQDVTSNFMLTSYQCAKAPAGYSICFGKWGGSNLNYGFIDVNGPKGPNKMGVDFYRIYFKKNGRLIGISYELIQVMDNDWNIDF